MKSSKYIFLFLILIFLFHSLKSQNILYVSPHGQGKDYTKEKPGNIRELKEKLHQVADSSGTKTVVLFSGGTYYLNEPLIITGLENKFRQNTLEFSGLKNEKAILSGGQKIEKWEKYKNEIYRAKVPVNADFRQFYIDGKMAVRARTPNRQNEDDYSPYNRLAGFDEGNKMVLLKTSEMPRLSEWSDVELVINQHWYQSRFKIESFSIDKDTARIVPVESAKKYLFQLTYAKMLFPDKPYYFENALEFLDQGGEWYLDKKGGYVYYQLKEGEDIQQIEAVYPVLDVVVDIKGNPENPVYNIVLNNLEIAHSNWLVPSREGIIGTQGVQGRGYPGEWEAGVVQVKYARNVSIEHCNITGAGDNGILFSKGVQNSKINNCHIYQISANGVVVDTYRKAFPPDSLVCKNVVISDNLIEHIGMHYTNGMGIIASCVEKIKIENNEIRFGRYTGMQLGNHYGDNLNGMRDNLIRRNNIHHVMQLHDDGGAIYTLSLQPGTRIIQNWLHDFTRCTWADNFPVNAIFLDNSSSYIRVQDNVMTDLPNVDRIKEQCAGNAVTKENILVNNNTQDLEIKQQSGVRGVAGVLSNDPFQPYLTGRPPVIVEDLGFETTDDGIKVHKFVFLSRMIKTQEGDIPSYVYAAVAFPKEYGPHPAVVRLHGGGGYADIPAAVSSARRGYVSMVLDIPGVSGKIRNPKTSGPWMDRQKIAASPDASYSALFDAVLSSIQSVYYVKSLSEVDKSRVAVAGASWGGYTATMVSSILGDELAATWSVFGSGNFLAGAFEKSNIEKLPELERQEWLKYMDPGSRARSITKPFFLATASNDRHWSWMAVQKTLKSMRGSVNLLYSPNTNHLISCPGGSGMLQFLDQYLQKGSVLPKISQLEAKRLKNGDILVNYVVDNQYKAVQSKVYYTRPDEEPLWTERKWQPVDSRKTEKGYQAVIPAGSAKTQVDLFAYFSDVYNSPTVKQDSITVTSFIINIK